MLYIIGINKILNSAKNWDLYQLYNQSMIKKINI